MPQAISKEKPAKVRGERGVWLRPPGTDAGRILLALRAALSKDNRRPLIAYSMINMCGSAKRKENEKFHEFNTNFCFFFISFYLFAIC